MGLAAFAIDQRVSPGETTISITEAELGVFEASAPPEETRNKLNTSNPVNPVSTRRPLLVRRTGRVAMAAADIGASLSNTCTNVTHGSDKKRHGSNRCLKQLFEFGRFSP